MPGQGVGGIHTLGTIREVRRIARTYVKAALALPERAQVPAHGCDVAETLFSYRFRQQGTALRLQFQCGARAAVAPVVPFQRHDAAAGTQVRRVLGALWLTETGQQQCVRAKAVGRRTVYHGSIIQDFGRMFHRQCADSLSKNAVEYPAEFVHETKSSRPALIGLLLLMRLSARTAKIIQQ